MKKRVLVLACVFCALVLAISVFMDYKRAVEQREILEASIHSQLLSICTAAGEIIDMEAYMAYGSLEDVQRDQAAYDVTLARLRRLAEETGAEYIYVLRQEGTEYLFIFDTDEENEEIFVPYELSRVHRDAFGGVDSAGVMNVQDEFGSFNTGAVPLWYKGQVVGVVSADISDTYYQQSLRTSRQNTILLVVMLGASMAGVLFIFQTLMTRLRRVQDELEKLAKYDTVTGLPNRQYIMEYLPEVTGEAHDAPFALMFIDLDNFKRVNDNAGHDAGDELLRKLGWFLTLEAGEHTARAQGGLRDFPARIGGDEFVRVVPGVADEARAQAVADAMLQNFAGKDFGRYVEKYGVGMSVGVALYPLHSRSYGTLVHYADAAMYHAKHGGKNRACVYRPGMEETAGDA